MWLLSIYASAHQKYLEASQLLHGSARLEAPIGERQHALLSSFRPLAHALAVIVHMYPAHGPIPSAAAVHAQATTAVCCDASASQLLPITGTAAGCGRVLWTYLKPRLGGVNPASLLPADSLPPADSLLLACSLLSWGSSDASEVLTAVCSMSASTGSLWLVFALHTCKYPDGL